MCFNLQIEKVKVHRQWFIAAQLTGDNLFIFDDSYLFNYMLIYETAICSDSYHLDTKHNNKFQYKLPYQKHYLESYVTTSCYLGSTLCLQGLHSQLNYSAKTKVFQIYSLHVSKHLVILSQLTCRSYWALQPLEKSK